MANILQIDTSGNVSTVLLAVNGNVVSEEQNQQSRDHSANIHGMIGRVLAGAGLIMNELNAVAVCAGPGSYTGLRVGLAVAKGICYALDLPLLMEHKMRLLAGSPATEEKTEHIVVLKAREHEFFIAGYDAELEEILPPQHIIENELHNKLKNFTTNIQIHTDIEDLAKYLLHFNRIDFNREQSFNIANWAVLAFKDYGAQKFAILHEAEPFYLKEVYINKKS